MCHSPQLYSSIIVNAIQSTNHPLLLFQEELPFPFEHFLQRIARRPRPQQFYGLMGKRDAGEAHF